jgi:sulfite exporter TauE/SafE
MTTALLAGLALGLASSAHCAAMCGPLVMSVGRLASVPSRAAHLRHALLHHAARILVYALLAIPVGMAGEALTLRGLGRGVALGAGVLLMATAAGSVWRPGGHAGRAYAALVARVAVPLFRWAGAHRVAGPLATGAINGLLPCGLVYAALTTAGASGSAARAVVLMTGFGAATTVVLVALSFGAASLPSPLRARLRPLTPLVLAVAAAILIARGAAPAHDHHVTVSPAPHMHE